MENAFDENDFDLTGVDDANEWDLSGTDDAPAKPEATVGRMAGRFISTIGAFPGRLAATARSFLDANPVDPYKSGQEPSAANDDELYDSTFGRMDLERRARVMTNSDKYFADGMTNRDAYRRAVMEEAEDQRQDAISYFKEVEESTAMPDKYKQSSGFLEDVAGGLASGVTGVGAFFAGGPLLSAAVNYSEMHGYKIQELEELGVEDPNIKLRSAMVSAGMQTPMETLSNWIAVSKVMKANGTWQRWLVSTLETAAGEGATEFVQQFPDEYATILALNPDVPQRDLLKWANENKGEIFGKALYAGGVGAATGAIMGGAGGGVKIVIDRMVHPKQAQANEEKAERAKVLIDKAEAETIMPEEAAELGAVSEEQIQEVVAQVKKNVELNKPIETPQREEAKAALSYKLGNEAADTEIQVFDAMARSWADRTGNQPAQFYEDVVGVTAEGMPEDAGTEADLFQNSVNSKIFKAYQDLKKERGYSSVEIADIRDKAGVTQEEVTRFFRDQQNLEKNKISLSIGDWSSAPENTRSGAITFEGDTTGYNKEARRYLLARIDGGVVETEGLRQGERGSIQNVFGDGPALINLFANADPSTPIHEVGHLGLKLLFQTGDSDYTTLAEFAGVDAERAMIGPAEWTVDEHEKIAKAFEVYVMEGRAPSTRLQMAFAKLKQWLIDVYKSAKAHGVELSEEVRGVFDRLLTTDFERQNNILADVQEWVSVADLMGGATSAKEAETIKNELAARALDDAAFAATEYDEIVAKAREMAVAKVAKKRAAQEKKLKAAFKKEAEASLSSDPYYDMIDEILAAGGLKYDNVLSLYSKDWIGEIQRSRPGIIAHEGRAYADDIAMQYGYGSADALLQDIINRPSKKEAVDNYYDSLVREYESNLQYEDAAIYAETLQNEIDIINRMLGKPKKDTKLKKTIKEKTGQQKTPALKELAAQFKRDEQVSRNAWRKARKATKNEMAAKAKGEKIEAIGKERAKKLEKIAKLKLQQMEKMSALRDTFLERQNVKKSQDIINKALHTKSLPPEYQAQIAQFVSEFQDVAPGLKSATEGKSLDQFLNEKRLGNEYIVDEIAIRLTNKPQANFNKKGYRLPMDADAWERVADIVTMLKKMGIDEGNLLGIHGKTAVEDVVNDMQQEAFSVWGAPEAKGHPLEQLQELKERTGWFNRLSDGAKGYLAWIKRTDFVFDALQGYKKDRINGKNFQIQNWIDAATNAELKDGAKAVKQLKKIFSWIKNSKDWAQQKQTIQGLPVSITKEDMIGIALHSDNKQNRTALIYGYGITDAQIDAVVKALSPREMKMVEDLWAFADQFYAPLNELHKNLTGAPLKKVEGRYWPLKPQRGLSQKAESFALKESEQDLFAHAFSTPNVSWGSRHERTGMKIAPDLSLNMILRHTVQVLHDIHFQIPVRNANKVIAHPAYNQMVTDIMGEDVFKVLKPWLVHVARPNPDPIGRPEQLFRKLRTNSTVVGMGLRFIQLFDQLSGITASIPEVGEANIMKAIYHVATSPREAVKFAQENSAVMANLQATWDRDLATFYDEFNASNWGGAKKWMKDAFFIFSTLPDRAVRYTVWHGAYMQGLDIHQGDLEKAARHADTVTSSTQGTGMVKDLNTWLRGGENRSELIKLFTMFQGFFSVLGNNLGKTWTRYRLGETNMAEMVKAYMWMVLIPALFSKILRDKALPEGDEWYKAPISFVAASLPLVRDVLSPWLSGYRYQLTPVAQAGESASRLIKTALDPESDEWIYNSLKEGIRLSGYAFGLPTGQAMVTMDGVQDLMSGETDDPTALLWRTSKPK